MNLLMTASSHVLKLKPAYYRLVPESWEIFRHQWLYCFVTDHCVTGRAGRQA
jgi:hypothetical protein